MNRKLGLALAVIAGALIVEPIKADVITDWNNVLLNAVRATSLNPPRTTRALAMMHCAMYDAVNALNDEKYVSFNMTAQAPKGNVSEKAAAAQAAYQVLRSLFTGASQQAAFDAALAQSLAGIPNGPKTKGVNWGKICGNSIISLRKNDGANLVLPYNPILLPGFWRPTPPGNAPALLPNWPYVRCWTMDVGPQFRAPGPPPLNSAAYATALNEVKELGRIDSATRTAEQTQIALFWADGAGTSTPPGHWNIIAQRISQARNLNTLQNARLFAMLNCAMADAAISCWDNKYWYNFWRPITAIQLADTDNNPATVADPAWTPLIATPPFPSYTSGHSTFSGAAARIISGFFGSDAISFVATSEHPAQPGVTRAFNSLDAAADEAADSRLYGGIHFRFENLDGLLAGRDVAANLLANFFGLRGDLNHDGLINNDDLILLLAAFGSCGGPQCQADLNHDGVVNQRDVHELMRIIHRNRH